MCALRSGSVGPRLRRPRNAFASHQRAHPGARESCYLTLRYFFSARVESVTTFFRPRVESVDSRSAVALSASIAI